MAYSLDDLLLLMSRLRDKDGGCPWDLAQDFQSITSSTLEEAYELVDAIFANDQQQIKEELGDVLFQVVFYAQLAREKHWFDFAGVVDVITAKLVSRHPHVFPDGDLQARFDSAIDVEGVKQQWEAIKQSERKTKHKPKVLDDIPLALPALSRAQKIQKRVSQVGFDWNNASAALLKIREELDELQQAIDQQESSAITEELGDVLFSCVNVARHLKVDAESALAASNRKFEARFGYIEDALAIQGKTPAESTLAEMDALWESAKIKLIKK
jgi:nucleoside triphosphate diphosphatase